MPDRVLICEGRTGIIVSASGAAARFLAREDLEGRSLAEVLPEGALAARLREMGELTADCPSEREWTFVANGRNVTVHVTLASTDTRCMIAITPTEPAVIDASA